MGLPCDLDDIGYTMCWVNSKSDEKDTCRKDAISEVSYVLKMAVREDIPLAPGWGWSLEVL